MLHNEHLTNRYFLRSRNPSIWFLFTWNDKGNKKNNIFYRQRGWFPWNKGCFPTHSVWVGWAEADQSLNSLFAYTYIPWIWLNQLHWKTSESLVPLGELCNLWCNKPQQRLWRVLPKSTIWRRQGMSFSLNLDEERLYQRAIFIGSKSNHCFAL